MEERKSMGGAIVDVFDAGVTLVKSEINALVKKLSDIAKAKGLGVVLLLAATGPLILALIFLILAVFYGLMRLGAGAWFAALLIAVFSLVVTGVMVVLGLRKLGADVETNEPQRSRSETMTEDERLEAQYQAEQAEKAARERRAAQAAAAASATPAGTGGAARAPVQGEGSVEVPRNPGLYAGGENRYVAGDGQQATVRVEGGTSTVPVYESGTDGAPQMYGSTLNEKLDKGEVASANHAEPGVRTDHHHDPRLQEPVALHDAPGITVSTQPTYKDDIKKGGGES